MAAKKVWIDLDRIKERDTLYAEASKLMEQLEVSLDYWGRGPVEISDDAFALIHQFELNHQDNPETFEEWEFARPCMFSIMDELTPAEFAACHQARQHIENHIEYSWQK